MATFQVKIAILVTLLVIYWLIITPLIVYFIFKFIQESQNMVLQKRKPHLTLYLSIISLVAVAILYPMYLYFAMNFQHVVTDHILAYCIPILYGTCTFSFIYIITLRYWIIFYDVNFLKASNDQQWKKFIDENEEKCWFLTHKSSFGNTAYCTKIITIPWFLTCVIIVAVDITNDANLLWSIVNFVAIFLPLSFVTILWKKTPKIDDEFRIIKEARYFCWVAVGVMLLYLLVGFSPAFGVSPFTRYILGNISGVINFSTATLWFLIHPLWIAQVHKYQQTLNALQSVQVRKPQSLSRNIDSNSNHNHDSILRQILSTEQSFAPFMDHLRNEWSMELLLSFIEISQFKHVLRQVFGNEIDAEILDKYCKYEYRQQAIINNEYIPSSSIVYDGYNDIEPSSTITLPSSIDIVAEKSNSTENQKLYKDYHDKAWKLCSKYIENGGEFQINLPDEQRRNIMKLMNDYFYNNQQMNINQLFCLFDDAMHELWTLMSYSFCRFISTEKYTSLNI